MDNNNAGAKYYDDIYGKYIDDDLTKKEVDLIISLIPKNGSVMDLGCGTGRHLIELSKKEIDVLGVDMADNMIKEVKRKYPKANVIKADIYKDRINRKFDLVMIAWNAIMEICKNERELDKLFKILKEYLKETGKMLVINLYDEDKPTEEGLDFSDFIEKNDKNYRLRWKLKQLDKVTNTTVCEEKIEVFDKNNNLIDRLITDIEQKWWRKSELEEIGYRHGLTLRESKIKGSEYHYYVFEQ